MSEKSPISGHPGPSFRDVVISANKLAFVTGTSGFAAGYTLALLRQRRPMVLGFTGAAVWFPWGLSYWVSRHYMLDWLTRFNDAGINGASQMETNGATFTAAALSRLLVDGLFTMRIVVPQALFVGVFGLLGQSAVDAVISARGAPRHEGPTQSLMQRILSSKWLPMKKLTDEEYRDKLNENLTKLNVEISMVDDHLDKLKSSKPSS